MPAKKTTPISVTCMTYGLLGAALISCLVMPDSMVVAYIPEAVDVEPITYDMKGIVRDFRQAHDDFDVEPNEGYGHVAGNVSFGLSSDKKPVFNAGGDENGPFENRVAHWKFDEGAGLDAMDSMGSNHGTTKNGPAWTTGRIANALHFDGVDDYVEVPNSPEMQISGDITFAGWFKLDEEFSETSANTLVIMEKFLDTEHDFHIGFAGLDYNRAEVPKGTMVFKVENGPTSDYYCYVWTTQNVWQPDVWYHFACTLDATNTAKNAIFINGDDMTDSTVAAGVGFLDTSYNAPMRIGGMTIDYNGHATDIHFKGVIDDVMVFDRALTGGDFIYVPGGYKVDAEWVDKSSRNVAPHLAMASVIGTDEVNVVNAPSISGSPTIDTYSSADGVYGGANIGPIPVFVAGSPMEPVVFPAGLPFQSLLRYNGNGDSILSSDVHCEEFFVGNNHTLTIEGDVRIVADDQVVLQHNAAIKLAAGASLEIYSNGFALFENVVDVNANTSEPTRVRIYHLGAADMTIGDDVALHAWVYAPNGKTVLQSNGEFFGRFSGMSLFVNDTSAYHHDTAGEEMYDVCGDLLVDSEGVEGVRTDGAISSADSFDQWFRNVLGTNLAGRHTITLTKNGGVFEYLDEDFHPGDNKLFGNEGQAHNYFLTYAAEADFTYEACAGQFIEMQGGDGAWIFINDSLAIDLGGVISSAQQRLDLDRIGLTDGEECTMSLFYAQRHSMSSVFKLRTNIDLVDSETTVAVTGSFD